jgi:hypothetical protein
MPYTITYLDGEGIVFTEYEPPMTNEQLYQVVMDNLALAAEIGAMLFLGDCRTLPNSASLFDVYQIADLLDGLGVDHRMREALVVTLDPAGKSSFDFYVTVTSNRGLQVRLFADIGEAKAWLTSEGARMGLLPPGAPEAG